MSGIFRLRESTSTASSREPFGETVTPKREPRADRDTLGLLEEFVRRLSLCVEYAEAARVGLEALDDLFGFGFSILLTLDERGHRLFAVASNGYVASGVGAEVPIGVGIVGIAAERRRWSACPASCAPAR